MIYYLHDKGAVRMKKINVSYESGYKFPVYLVRYFRFKNNAYLIYTLQEKDHRNYMKLYVVKIMRELGELVTQTVRRPDEWNRMKIIVKNILIELKKKQLTSIEDLEPSELENVVIYDSKDFMMASDLVNILAQEIITNENENKLIEEKLPQKIDSTLEPEIEVLELEDDADYQEILELDDENSTEPEIEVLEL